MLVVKNLKIHNDFIHIEMSVILKDCSFVIEHMMATIDPIYKENKKIFTEAMCYMHQYCDWVICLCEADSMITPIGDKEVNISINGELPCPKEIKVALSNNIISETLNEMFDAIISFAEELETKYIPVNSEALIEGELYKFADSNHTLRYLGKFEDKHIFKDSEMLISPPLTDIRKISTLGDD